MTTEARKVDSQVSSRGRTASRETMCTDSPPLLELPCRSVLHRHTHLSLLGGVLDAHAKDLIDMIVTSATPAGLAFHIPYISPHPHSSPTPNLDLASELVFFSFFFLTTRTGQILSLGRCTKLFGSSCTSPSADPTRLSLVPRGR